jgi:hypothetical protein
MPLKGFLLAGLTLGLIVLALLVWILMKLYEVFP